MKICKEEGVTNEEPLLDKKVKACLKHLDYLEKKFNQQDKEKKEAAAAAAAAGLLPMTLKPVSKAKSSPKK